MKLFVFSDDKSLGEYKFWSYLKLKAIIFLRGAHLWSPDQTLHFYYLYINIFFLEKSHWCPVQSSRVRFWIKEENSENVQ